MNKTIVIFLATLLMLLLSQSGPMSSRSKPMFLKFSSLCCVYICPTDFLFLVCLFIIYSLEPCASSVFLLQLPFLCCVYFSALLYFVHLLVFLLLSGSTLGGFLFLALSVVLLWVCILFFGWLIILYPQLCMSSCCDTSICSVVYSFTSSFSMSATLSHVVGTVPQFTSIIWYSPLLTFLLLVRSLLLSFHIWYTSLNLNQNVTCQSYSVSIDFCLSSFVPSLFSLWYRLHIWYSPLLTFLLLVRSLLLSFHIWYTSLNLNHPSLQDIISEMRARAHVDTPLR